MLTKLAELLISYGPLGIFLLAAIDSAGIPLAGGADAFVLLLSIKAPRLAYWGAAAAVAGSAAGNVLLFLVARRGGRRYLERTREPGARSIRFRAWFSRYGLLTVFIPGLVPIPLPLKIFVISAGALGVPLAHFLGVVLVARVFRYFGLAYLGVRLGQDSTRFLRENAQELIGAAVAVAVLLYAAAKLRERYRTAG